jgi:glycosyltransferase involved in cell wall biosynthesis
MKYSICLVSSGQPSANPRLVKETKALVEAGYKVKVIYCPISPWADEFDKILFSQYPKVKWIKAGYHPQKQRLGYYFAKTRKKFWHIIFKLFGEHADSALKSSVLYLQELVKIAKYHKADLYIGHNLGALPAILSAAKRYNAKLIFDFEDFHRGEDSEGSLHWQKTIVVENKYVPSLRFATTSSPLITEAYANLYPSVKFTTIYNCFPISYLRDHFFPADNKVLKLFWFSQFIGKKRGIETVIEAIGLTGNHNIHLTLLGNCTDDMKSYFHALTKANGLEFNQVHILPSVEEKHISTIAATHHIGLACEVPHVINRDICLTNKIFLYLLAGNAILFSNTKAQLHFYNNHPEIGSIYSHNNPKELADLLQQYFQEPEILKKKRLLAHKFGKTFFNWEAEQKEFLQTISEINSL